MRGSKSKKRIIILFLAVVFFLFLSAGYFVYAVYNGVIILNQPLTNRYPIRGVDVSHYQGDIDWPLLSEQDIQFAFIKATEGSSHVDRLFLKNWEEAGKTSLKIGAYHFFSFDSPGQTQLEHFLRTVPKNNEMLPPVVDFEYYGNKKDNPPPVKETLGQLEVMLEGLEKEYQTKPVIYATQEVYQRYLEGNIYGYPIWIRSIVGPPDIGEQDWVMWQYTNREMLPGYSGEEMFIDMNVFSGNEKDWEFWSQCQEYEYVYYPGWGTFQPSPQYSYDGKYLAEYRVEKEQGGQWDLVEVTVKDGETKEKITSFTADRALDFWGICWEPDSYRIWTQSADVGLRCYEITGESVTKIENVKAPPSVISKYEKFEEWQERSR